MKATQIFIIFFTLKYLSKKSFGLLNEDEKSLTKALMKDLEIRHCILVQNENLTFSNLAKLKNYAKDDFLFMIISTSLFTKYLLKESIPDINTLVVLKVSDIKIVFNLLKTITLMHPCYYCLLRYKWIVFLNNILSVEEEPKLEIPSYSFFLVAQKKNFNTYFLKEIYKVKEKTFSFDYGTWNKNSGLITSNDSIFIRRFNFNNTKLIIDIGEDEGRYLNCPHVSVRSCSGLDVLKEFSRVMNFHLEWTSYPTNPKKSANTGDVLELSTGYNPDNLNFLSYDYVGPLFKIAGNWYMKRPILLEQSDYFIQPFHQDLWIYILIWLVISIIFAVILYCGNKYLTNQYKLPDLLFISFDNLCNQDGTPKKDGVSIKIACFTFRFLALFITSAYSGILISFLAIRQPQIPFQTLEEFVSDGTYLLGARSRTYAQTYFMVSKNHLIRHVYEKFFIGLDVSQIPEKFCNERVVIAEPDNQIYGIGINCPIYQFKKPISIVLTVIVLRKHSIYTRIFNHAFLKFYSSGIQKKMQDIVTGSRPNIPEDPTLSDVTFNQIIQVWSIVPIGIILASAILLCEIFFNRQNQA